MSDEIKEIKINTLGQLLDFVETEEKAKSLIDYITNLQQKVEQYENPDDLTLFYMWLDEKAKDKMKHLQQENERLKQKESLIESDINNAYSWLKDYKSRVEKAVECINNFSVDKSFSFPLMKRWEENQVKSSIDYEFKTTLYKDLLNILQGGKDE